jgi:autotransporter translocation and assembly factor TamB
MAPEQRLERRLKRRRARSWVHLLVGMPLLGVLGLVALAASPAGNRWLLLRILGATDLLFPGATLEVADLRTDVVRHLQLRELRLLDAQGRPLASVASLELQWQPLALLRGEVLVDSLVIRGPRAALRVDPEGRVDLLEALGLGDDGEEHEGGPWEGSPVDLSIARAQVVGGRIDAVLQAAEGPRTLWSVRDLELALGLTLDGRELAVDRAVLAARLGHQLGEEEQHWLPVGFGGSARLVDEPGSALRQRLDLQDLRLQLGSAVVGSSGSVLGLGEQAELDLDLALRDLLPGELAFLTGELGIEGPFALQATVDGPLEALALQATVESPEDAGQLRLGVGANLTSPVPSWTARLRLDGLEPHRFVPALDEPWLVHGELQVDGRGRGPEDVEAEIRAALEPGTVHGFAISGMSAKASAADGALEIEQLAFLSELGRASLLGRYDLASSTLRADLGVSGVRLERLGRLGITGLQGSAAAAGRLVLELPEGGPEVTVDAQLDVAGAGYGGLVQARGLRGPVSLRWAGGDLEVEGRVEAHWAESHGARVVRTEGPWRFDLEPDGAMAWQAELEAGGISYGVVRVGRARVAVEGGLPPAGELALGVGFDAAGLEAPSSVAPELRAERAAGRVDLQGDRIEVEARAQDGERSVLETHLSLDLASGAVHIPDLLVAPTPETAWRAVEPVRATIVDGGVRDLQLQLRSGDALLWGLGDFDPSGPVDLRLMVSDFTLDPLVPLFPGLPRGLEGTTRLALQVTGSADALALAGSVEVDGLVVPGSVRALDARLVLNGDGRDLGFQLELPEPGTDRHSPLLFASGSLPLRVAAAGATLDPHAPWELELLLAPGELERFARVLELDPLPEARLSAQLILGGSPAASTLDLGAAAELPLGIEEQRARFELDLTQRGDQAELELVMAQHMLRQAELSMTMDSPLRTVVRQQTMAAFGLPLPVVERALALDDVHSWVRELDARLVPLGISTEVLDRLVPLPAAMRGSLVGGLQLQGDPLRPEVAGALQLVDASLGEVGVAPAMITALPAEGGYDINLMLGFEGGGGLQLGGYVPVELDLADLDATLASLEREELELDIAGPGVPLAALAALLGETGEAEGLVAVQGTVGGSPLRPDPDLRVGLEGGSLTWPDLAVRYEDIRLAVSIEGDLAQLDELSMSSRPAYNVGQPGTLELYGGAMLDGWVPDAVDLAAEADGFWVIDTNRYRLRCSADLAASGRWPALEVDGAVRVNDGRFVLDESLFLYSGTLDLDPRLQIVRPSVEERIPEEPEPPFYQDIRLDVDLDLSRATTVQVEMPFDDTLGALWASALTILIETRMDGQLELGMQDAEISLLGEVEPVWGRADILGARFALGEGLISFVGGDPFDPILDLEAVHGTAKYGDVAVDITGSLEDMGLAFRSEQYPDETDIVSILLMGAPRSELSQKQAPGVQALYSMAVGALMGELESQGAGGNVVDMVELTGDSFAAGRAFGDDIFVTVKHEPGAEVDQGENKTEVTLDWTITRSWSAEFVTGDQGTSSADLYWTWRF